MIGRGLIFASLLAVVPASHAFAQSRAPRSGSSDRVNADISAKINRIMNNVINQENSTFGKELNSRIIIWEDDPVTMPTEAQSLPARFERPTDPAAIKQWIAEMAKRPETPSSAELQAMTDAEFADFLSQRNANARSSNTTQSNLIDDLGLGGADWNIPIHLPSLESQFAQAMRTAPDGDFIASSLQDGNFAVAFVLPIYAGYAVVPAGAAMTSQNVQVLTPSAVMVVPSTQVMGMPSDVMTVPGTQIAVTSTQVQVPGSVMSSPDLQPALCGR